MNPSSVNSSNTNIVSACHNTTKKKLSKNKKHGGVELSTVPQGVAARHRRRRISDRFKILRSLVPGGAKMDTVSMLEEAIQYVKFLKDQIWLHQAVIGSFACNNNNTNNYNNINNADYPTLNFQQNMVNSVHHEQVVDFSSGYDAYHVQICESTQDSWFHGEGLGPF